MKNYYFIILISLISSSQIFGQETLFKFTFNDCTGEEEMTRVPGITFVGDPSCECGVGGNSYDLTGNDFMQFSPILNSLFSQNFTFDFYFYNATSSIGESYVFSHGSDCARVDSLMRLRYFGNTKEYNFEIASNVNNYHSVKFKVDESKCWHRFTLVKFNLEYLLYIDNHLVSKFLAKETINLSKIKPILFGSNLCDMTGSSNFIGRIDDISLINAASSRNQIKNSDVLVDRIINDNQTIFKGNTVTLNIGQSCSDLINWSPTSTLDTSMGKIVIATPDVTTTYVSQANFEGCNTIDSVTIYVTSRELLDCEKLLLPTAFTPNNDGLNDTYHISNQFVVEQLEFFEIYARNGAKVWETKSLADSWDGTMNGSLQSSGTYMYRIKFQCSGEEYLKADNFMLIR